MFPRKSIFILIFIAAVLLCGKEANAATEFISTIRATGGDYSLLSTWEAAVQSNLTASTTVVYSGTGTGGLPAGATLELFRAGVYQDIIASTTATSTTQILVNNFSGAYKVLQDGDQWRVASSTANMWTVSSAGLGDSAIAVAECYNDWPTGLNDKVALDGWTTNVTNYIKIYAPEGERHNGWTWTDTSKNTYSGFAIVINGDWYTIYIKESYTVIDGIIVNANKDLHSYTSAIVAEQASYATIKNCIAFNADIQAFYAYINGGDMNIVNCIAYDSTYGFRRYDWRTAWIYNSTFHNNTTAGVNASGLGDGFVHVKNVISTNNAIDFAGDAVDYNADSSNNSSSDATAPGTGNRINQTFTFVDEANDDFHLSPSDSGAKNQGTDLSADASYPITNDIDYQIRPYGGIWDIGADETPSSAFKFNNGTFKIRGSVKFE